jgi:hypothetical protein
MIGQCPTFGKSAATDARVPRTKAALLEPTKRPVYFRKVNVGGSTVIPPL